MLQCSLVIDLQPSIHPTDKANIPLLLIFLWTTAAMENQIPAYAHYGIKCEFNHVFQYLVCGAEAVTGLLSLKQGPVTVADVSIQFHILADGMTLRSGKSTSSGAEGLLKMTLQSETLITFTTCLDTRLRKRQREKASLRCSFPPISPTSEWLLICDSLELQTSSSLSVAFHRSMQLGQARLTHSERQRRLSTKACLYCGQQGHFVTH